MLTYHERKMIERYLYSKYELLDGNFVMFHNATQKVSLELTIKAVSDVPMRVSVGSFESLLKEASDAILSGSEASSEASSEWF